VKGNSAHGVEASKGIPAVVARGPHCRYRKSATGERGREDFTPNTQKDKEATSTGGSMLLIAERISPSRYGGGGGCGVGGPGLNRAGK